MRVRSTLRLRCNLQSASEEYDVTWYKDDQRLSPSEKHLFTSDAGGASSLTISHTGLTKVRQCQIVLFRFTDVSRKVAFPEGPFPEGRCDECHVDAATTNQSLRLSCKVTFRGTSINDISPSHFASQWRIQGVDWTATCHRQNKCVTFEKCAKSKATLAVRCCSVSGGSVHRPPFCSGLCP